MIEIEKKCWLKDPERMLADLHKNAHYIKKSRKEDVYFIHKDYNSSHSINRDDKIFRLRIEEGKHIVTFKEKRIEKGIEINQENEFFVSDQNSFLQFVQYIDYQELVTKVKEVELFKYNDISVEYVFLHGLGYFLEAEILCQDESEVNLAVNKIDTLFTELNIDPASVEEKMYIDLLLKKKKG